MLSRFWGPVGSTVKSDDDVAFVTSYLFGGRRGDEAISHIEQTIRRLPGLEWFDLLGRARASAVARCGVPLEASAPVEA